MKSTIQECKCYICGKPMDFADWYDQPCCIDHIIEQLNKATEPAPVESPAFTKEGLDGLIERVRTINHSYTFCTTSDEVAEELRGIYPFADVHVILKDFTVTMKDRTSGEQVYIIPTEPKPVKVVFDSSLSLKDFCES